MPNPFASTGCPTQSQEMFASQSSDAVFHALTADPCPMIVRFLGAIRPFTSVLVSPISLDAGKTSPAIAPVLPDDVLTAAQALITLMDHLRSPDSGWTADVPQTPENLLPYVNEEAYGLLEAVQQMYGDWADLPGVHGSAHLSDTIASTPYLLEKVLPGLLWGVARSSYEVMRLLEGIPAVIFGSEDVNGEGGQSGMLRLVITLEMKTATASYSLDLATKQPPPPLLSDTTLVGSKVCVLCLEPVAIAELRDQILQNTQVTTPAMQPLWEGMPTEWLMPQHPWQTGHINLHLGFEFTPMVKMADESDGIPGMAEENEAIESPVLRFTEADWLADYQATVIRQQLQDALLHQQRDWMRPLEKKSAWDDHILPLIQDADWISNLFYNVLSRSNREFLHPAIALDHLSRWLLWCLSRSDYEIMQFMGGIPSQVLQPEAMWQTGTLRLLASLRLKTLEQDWHLDLSTGQSVQREGETLSKQSVVYSDASQWCVQPTLLETLYHQVIQHIERNTPELQLLIQGTGVDVLCATHPVEGAMQVELVFEFIPDCLDTSP